MFVKKNRDLRKHPLASCHYKPASQDKASVETIEPRDQETPLKFRML